MDSDPLDNSHFEGGRDACMWTGVKTPIRGNKDAQIFKDSEARIALDPEAQIAQYPEAQDPKFLTKELMHKMDSKEFRNARHPSIKVVEVNISTCNYNSIIKILRQYFRKYVPFSSIPLLRVRFFGTSQELSFDGIAALSNGYLLAIDKDGTLLEFGELDKNNKKQRFIDSHFIGFAESYPKMNKGVEGLEGLIGLDVGYHELQGAIDKIINEYKDWEDVKTYCLRIKSPFTHNI